MVYGFSPSSFASLLNQHEKSHNENLSSLCEIVRNLQAEVTALKTQITQVADKGPIYIPAPPPVVPALAAASASQAPAPPPPPPPPAAAAPSWATVARRSKKKKTSTFVPAGTDATFSGRRTESYAQFARTLATTTTTAQKPSPPKRQQVYTTPPLRPRRLIAERDGSELYLTPMELRDALNKALGFTAILSTQVSRGHSGSNTGHVSITLMENLLATKLYAKVGEHLNTIPGALSLHLDSPDVQMVVHGVPTSISL